jgi:hypothetical protein
MPSSIFRSVFVFADFSFGCCCCCCCDLFFTLVRGGEEEIEEEAVVEAGVGVVVVVVEEVTEDEVVKATAGARTGDLRIVQGEGKDKASIKAYHNRKNRKSSNKRFGGEREMKGKLV